MAFSTVILEATEEIQGENGEAESKTRNSIERKKLIIGSPVFVRVGWVRLFSLSIIFQLWRSCWYTKNAETFFFFNT